MRGAGTLEALHLALPPSGRLMRILDRNNGPSSHRFVGDIQTALGEQIFHIAVAEGKTKVEPHRAGGTKRRVQDLAKKFFCR